MKKLLHVMLLALSTTFVCAQVSKTVNVSSAGTLSTLASSYLTTVTNLTITGKIDARDFLCMRNAMTKLVRLDISGVTIVAYSGTGGTNGTSSISYPSNTLPNFALSSKNLTSIDLPSSITAIGFFAFKGCSNLTSIIIPSSVTSIGGATFDSCSRLSSVSIPSSVTSIGQGAFYSCTSLKTITIPSSVTSIGIDAFADCTLTSSIVSISVTTAGTLSNLLTNYPSPLTSLTIVGTIDYRDLTTIQSKTALTAIDLSGATIAAYSSNPANTIGGFNSNSKLTTIVFPTSTTFIAGFNDCTALTNVTIPSSVTTIGSYAFSGCTELTSINIPASVSSIGTSAFQGSSGLISVEANNPAYSSLNGVLFNKAKTVLVKATVSLAGSYIIPSTVTSVGDYAFNSCLGLTSVTIPTSVKSIGLRTFSNSGLTSITIPNSVTSIGADAFRSCLGLKTLTYPKVVTMGDLVFAGCTSLISVTVPSSVTTIGMGAFDHCSSLKSVSISNSVTSIGWGAFRWCTGLTSVIIPASVISISSSAFQDCTALTSIYAYPVKPVPLTEAEIVFYNVKMTSCTLYVPKGSKSSYESAYQWNDFQNIVELTTAAVPTVAEEIIEIYPNPITEGFKINGIDGKASIKLIDKDGRVFFSKSVVGDEYIPMKGIPSGVYVIVITTNSEIVTRKIIKT